MSIQSWLKSRKQKIHDEAFADLKKEMADFILSIEMSLKAALSETLKEQTEKVNNHQISQQSLINSLYREQISEIRHALQDYQNDFLKAVQAQIKDLYKEQNEQFKLLNTRLKVFDRDNATVTLDVYRDGLLTGIKESMQRAEMEAEYMADKRFKAMRDSHIENLKERAAPSVEQILALKDTLRDKCLELERGVSKRPELKEAIVGIKAQMELLDLLLMRK